MNAFTAMISRSGGGPVPPPPSSFTWLNGGLVAGLGDSLTRGTGSTGNANGYLPQLQVLLADLDCTVDIINGGIDSATTAVMNGAALSTIDPFFDPDRVCVFLYEGGGNDIYFSGDSAVAGAITGNWTGLDARASGWRKMLIVSPDRGLPPSLGTPPISPGGQTRDQFRASMTTMRSGLVMGYIPHAEQIVQLQDDPSLICTDTSVCSTDETHWNDDGYALWAADVLAILGTMS